MAAKQLNALFGVVINVAFNDEKVGKTVSQACLRKEGPSNTKSIVHLSDENRYF